MNTKDETDAAQSANAALQDMRQLVGELGRDVAKLVQGKHFDVESELRNYDAFLHEAQAEFAIVGLANHPNFDASTVYNAPEKDLRVNSQGSHDFALLYIVLPRLDHEAVRKVGRRINSLIRWDDFAARVTQVYNPDGSYKGSDKEEYLVLLKNAGRDEEQLLKGIIGRIHKGIRGIKLTTENPLNPQIGYAISSKPYQTLDGMITEARQKIV